MKFVAALLSTAVLAATYASAQSLTSTAGVGVSQNVGNGATSVAPPAGGNGLSTGSSVMFSALSTGPGPASLTAGSTNMVSSGDEASLATQSSQNSGSSFLYTTTTGRAIAGISTGLSGGYNQDPAATSTDAAAMSATADSGSGSGSGSSDAALAYTSFDSVFTVMLAGAGMVAGALYVL